MKLGRERYYTVTACYAGASSGREGTGSGVATSRNLQQSVLDECQRLTTLKREAKNLDVSAMSALPSPLGGGTAKTSAE